MNRRGLLAAFLALPSAAKLSAFVRPAPMALAAATKRAVWCEGVWYSSLRALVAAYDNNLSGKLVVVAPGETLIVEPGEDMTIMYNWFVSMPEGFTGETPAWAESNPRWSLS